MSSNTSEPSRSTPVRTRTSHDARRTAWNVSSRLSTRRTGRPARRAAKATSGSYLACCLPPKPPPGSGAKTRTFASGRPRTFAMTFWSQFGCWIVLQTATPSPSGAAMYACGSIAKWVTIGNV